MKNMNRSGVQDFIGLLRREGEIIEVDQFVNPELEITEITDRISKQNGGGKAILFSNNGTRFPVLMNGLGSERRISLAFNRNSVSEIENEIAALFGNLVQPRESLWDKLRLLPALKEVSEWMPRKLKGKGKCQEVVMDEPDLFQLPVLKCWPADGGPFITLPGVHTVDPETGLPNLGMYRMQVFEKNLTGMHWHKHKTGANHYMKYKKLGKKMPVSVALGGDLAYTYAATAPMPENIDEYLLAGFLRKKSVKLVKCLTNELYVPEDADFVIEGFVDPAGELIWEGPFGDHTGFYSLADWYPKFHVTCITHRKDAIYPATIVGVPPQEDAYIGLATERIFLSPIRLAMVPELKDMTLPVAGVAHNFTLVNIEKTYPGQAVKVMNSLWGAGQMMFNKVLVVTNENVNIHDPEAVLNAFAENFSPAYSLHFSKGPLDVLDHASSNFAFGSKLGIDLTVPFPEESGSQYTQEKTSQLPEIKNIRQISEITDVLDLLEKRGLPVLLATVDKNSDFKINNLIQKLQEVNGLEAYKLILLFDKGVVLNDFFILLWLLGGNLEPARDISIITFPDNRETVVVDSTFKTGENDNFKREWPNIVTMDTETIGTIDRRWNELGLGDFLESPSLRLKQMVDGDGAVRGQSR